MSTEALAEELQKLSCQMAGITGVVLATVDGLVVAADTREDVDPELLAALAAATLALGRRTVQVGDQGAFGQIAAYGTAGCVVVLAVGETAVLAVLGDEGLDLALLARESAAMAERIADTPLASVDSALVRGRE